MFKKTVTYKNFNDVECTEDLYFHMMAPEFADLEFNPTFGGSLASYIKEAMLSGEGQKVYTFFKMMIVNSYGRRSEDGSKFLKRPEFTEEFLNSPAYEQFFLWLTIESPDGKNGEAFWNAIIPESLRGKDGELEKQLGDKRALKDLSRAELEALLEKVSSTSAPKVIDSTTTA